MSLSSYNFLTPSPILLFQPFAQCVRRIGGLLLGEALRPQRYEAIRLSRFDCSVKAKLVRGVSYAKLVHSLSFN